MTDQRVDHIQLNNNTKIRVDDLMHNIAHAIHTNLGKIIKICGPNPVSELKALITRIMFQSKTHVEIKKKKKRLEMQNMVKSN